MNTTNATFYSSRLPDALRTTMIKRLPVYETECSYTLASNCFSSKKGSLISRAAFLWLHEVWGRFALCIRGKAWPILTNLFLKLVSAKSTHKYTLVVISLLFD